ncbi:bifunctional methylenetetrahydrofolate dehydrogenase/methenyltetrahydrofolate cyclohydrolase FolD [Bradyrhizobium sp. USDA 3650]
MATRLWSFEIDQVMAAQIIDGKAIAAVLRHQVASKVDRFVATYNTAPGLAVVLVGEDPASSIYVKSKIRFANRVGINSFEHRLPACATEQELIELILALNEDPAVDGILVQLPLPRHIDGWRVLESIDVHKDVDGFHPYNAGRVSVGRPMLAPCTPLGVIHLIRTVLNDLDGLDVAVVGRSNLVGKPVGVLLGDAGCTVTAAQLQTRDLPGICNRADVIVVAAGSPGLIRGHWVKPGATIIDVGINRVFPPGVPSRIVGDVDFEQARERAAYITPVPGGVGPMTVAYLLRNTMTAAESRRTARNSRVSAG